MGFGRQGRVQPAWRSSNVRDLEFNLFDVLGLRPLLESSRK
ncbi:acyl-CoA dehydrogenase N-terminal domain-containing protein [Mycolicibacterium brisbanense]|nr:acyl-CoA dehydrogenase N-terminal domain-containing protein [Mycolicibacterium brisbanense]